MEVRSSDRKKGAGDGTNGCFDDVKEGLDHVPALAADLRVDVAEMLDVVRRAVSEDHLPLHVTPPACPPRPPCRAPKTSTPMIRTGIQAVRTLFPRRPHLTTAPSPSALKTRQSSPRSNIR